LIAIVGKKNTI